MCWPQLCEHGSSAKPGLRAPPPAPATDWFSLLFAFSEQSHEAMQRVIRDGWLRAETGTFGPTGAQAVRLVSDVNRQAYNVGYFETPSLGQLRRRVARSGAPRGRLRVTNEIGDVAEKHALADNRYATFQVASQFNCLEMIGPGVVPEEGVTRYVQDQTQGPACCIACGPSAVYRNYFSRLVLPSGQALPPDAREPWGARVQLGQSHQLQINNLAELGAELGNDPPGRYFTVQNGYSMSSEASLHSLNSVLLRRAAERENLMQALRVGVQNDAQVTFADWGTKRVEDPRQLVTQVFGSACAVAYSRSTTLESWAPLAKLVLDASYECTLCAAALTAARHQGAAGSRRVFLTCLGGGVFGNAPEWISDAMRRAFALFRDFDLDVRIVSHCGPVAPHLVRLEQEVVESA